MGAQLRGCGWLDTLLGPEETDLWDCDRIPVIRVMSGSRFRGLAPLAPGWRDGAPAVAGAFYGGQSCGLWDLMQGHPLAIPVQPSWGWVFGGLVGWLLFVV